MLGPNDYQQENITLTQQTQKNHFLDEYNGKPTLETIRQLILQKRETGDLSRKIWVDVGWALEKEEFFISQTNFTWASVQNAPKKLYEMQQDMLSAQNKANLEHQKCQDLLVENALITERLDTMAEEYKDKEAVINTKLESRIIKLPINRVSSFLAFCEKEELENPQEEFYIKIDDNGNMQRIVRRLEEL